MLACRSERLPVALLSKMVSPVLDVQQSLTRPGWARQLHATAQRAADSLAAPSEFNKVQQNRADTWSPRLLGMLPEDCCGGLDLPGNLVVVCANADTPARGLNVIEAQHDRAQVCAVLQLREAKASFPPSVLHAGADTHRGTSDPSGEMVVASHEVVVIVADSYSGGGAAPPRWDRNVVNAMLGLLGTVEPRAIFAYLVNSDRQRETLLEEQSVQFLPITTPALCQPLRPSSAARDAADSAAGVNLPPRPLASCHQVARS